MKRVCEADLHRMALAKGASISHGAGELNSARERLRLAPRPEPRAPGPRYPEPEPAAPAPAPALDLDRVVSAAVAAAGQHNVDKMSGLVASLVAALQAQQAAAVKPVSGWTFTVVRAGPGPGAEMTITATAIR